MSSTWRFGDLEFVVLWERLTGENLPAPFIFTSRTPLLFDYLREKREEAERLEAKWDRSLDHFAQVVARPDLRIVVTGFDARDPQRADGRIRMIALRRGERGYLMKQLPGETYMHSSGFEVRECDALRLADEVADALPESEAGREADITLVDPRQNATVEHEVGRTIIDDVFGDSVNYRSKKFLATVPVRMGTIEVVQGYSEYGPRGAAVYGLQWRDLQDDGRYAISGEPPHVAVAVDRKRLITLINSRVAEVVRRIKDERQTLRT